MSAIYDNWERLVWAVLRNEDLKVSGLRTPSDLSLASSSSFSYSFSSSSPRISSFNLPEIISSPRVSSLNLAELSSIVVKAATKIFYLNNKRKKIGGELYPEGICDFQLIKVATANFDPRNEIGKGRFGAVYKGVLPDGVGIAVKRLSPKSIQIAREIINEIGTIYALQHPNLARPMGCCSEKYQILLVYEYMENISLQHALFDSEEVKSRLNWQTRVKICLGMAKGLAYLHEESELDIIHSNIKPSNILLDKDFNVKISDFGYVELPDAQVTNVQRNEQGATGRAKITGYMAPEQIQGFPLTPKVDVYSFGIVALEIVSGQKIITPRSKDQNIYLLNTAYEYKEQNNLIALVDSRLGNEYKTKEANAILDLAMACVSPSFDLRPTMSHAVKVLEGKIKVKAGRISVAPLPDSKMAEPLATFSRSTQSGISQERYNSILSLSTSKGTYWTRELNSVTLLEKYFPVLASKLTGVELYPGGVYNFQQIRAATDNFKNKIGEGRGTFYKGVLPDGVEIAVKRLSPKSKQRALEIIYEIGAIYALQHKNLARPMGCCTEKYQILLVYEYMENISLQHALFDSEEVKSRLNWQTRVKICLGMAKGLAYLHEESELDIIHSNIKPSNILLDKDFNVKISDFGYVELPDAQVTNVQRNEQGATGRAKITGYMAPEQIRGFPLTPKVDVYGFGIVALEIVSGREIITPWLKDQNIYLLNTAYQYQEQNNLIALVDSRLGKQYKTKEANAILDLAMECVSPSFDLRPTMSHAVKVLEGKIKLKAGHTSVAPFPDSKMAEPLATFSRSTQSGSSSQERSNAILSLSTSKEIDNDSIISAD